uniref:Uncharacterized protein n=1 Tax=Rousettus aegyptiacus TaxID=9407 RepID=A0A7J8F110_ROUAE|nr:hypothetical protein HJG63_012392 [Rousettus aegyptiacus]
MPFDYVALVTRGGSQFWVSQARELLLDRRPPPGYCRDSRLTHTLSPDLELRPAAGGSDSAQARARGPALRERRPSSAASRSSSVSLQLPVSRRRSFLHWSAALIFCSCVRRLASGSPGTGGHWAYAYGPTLLRIFE